MYCRLQSHRRRSKVASLVGHPFVGIVTGSCPASVRQGRIVGPTPTDCLSWFENELYAAESPSESGNEDAYATDSRFGFSDSDYHYNTFHLMNRLLKHPIAKSPRSCWTAAVQAAKSMAMPTAKATTMATATATAAATSLAWPLPWPLPLPLTLTFSWTCASSTWMTGYRIHTTLD